MTEDEKMYEQLDRLAVFLDGIMPGCAELVRKANNKLKEQEPIEPINVNDSITETWFVCGNCGLQIGPSDKFCSDCGRAVKWNDDV